MPAHPTTRPMLWRALDVLVATAALLGAASLAVEFGFYEPLALPRNFLRAYQFVAAAAFLLDVPARFLIEDSRKSFLHQWWPDLTLAGALAAVVAGELTARAMGLIDVPLGTVLRGTIQAFVAAELLMRAIRVNIVLARSGIHPARLMVVTFLAAILLGAAALKLPRAMPRGTAEPLSWTDALFTSTSAVCVTGLTVRHIGDDQQPGTPAPLLDPDAAAPGFSRIGQAIILILIQLGGLGIMISGTIFAVMLGRAITLRHSMVMQDMLSAETLGSIRRAVRFIFLATFAIEGFGAALLYTMYSDFDWPTLDKTFNAIFISVSAFCNCGMSLTNDSMVRYNGYWQVHGIIAPLVVLGGLGFPVLLNVFDWIADRVRRAMGRRPTAGPVAWQVATAGDLRSPVRRPARLSLHSKLVLITSGILILSGGCGLLVLEHLRPVSQIGRRVETLKPNETDLALRAETAARPTHVLAEESAGQSIADAFFMSVVSRTAGFTTVDMAADRQALSQGSNLLMIVLMVIGGGPASTAGGMKITTFVVLALTVSSVIRRRNEAEVFGRSLPIELVRKAATLGFCYLALVMAVTLLLTVTEAGNGFSFETLLYESASACGTVGLSIGDTPRLTTGGKNVVIAAMFIGRLGPLTLLMALAMRMRPARYELPHENVVLG